MSQNLDLARLARNERFIFIPMSTTVRNALAMLSRSNAVFAVGGSEDQPQMLVNESQLMDLASKESLPLSEVLDQLPPLVEIDCERVVSDTDDLEIAYLLEKTQAPGLIAYQHNQIIGIIPQSIIAEASPPYAFFLKFKQLAVSMKCRRFVCGTCGDKRCVYGNKTPTCTVDGQ